MFHSLQISNKSTLSTKVSFSRSNGHVKAPSGEAYGGQQQAHNNSYLDHPSTALHHENQASHATDSADDTASAGWSHIETQGYGITSQGQEEIHRMDETYTYELWRWTYETSDASLTLAERLEKRKWEAERVEILK
jgi:hypothetical protein